MNEREIILEALIEILEKKEYSHLVVRAVLDKYTFLEKQKRSFIKRCCEGTIEQLLFLDYCINQFSKTKTNKMKPFIRTLIRMGAYQILFMDQVPDSAACNECVKLAKKRGFAQLSGFVNGVLRTLSREKEHISLPDMEKDFIEYLSVKYSMPKWIVSMWQSAYGKETAIQILQGLLEERPLMIRMRENHEPEKIEDCLRQMSDEGIRYKNCTELAYAYELSNVDNVRLLPGYEEGIWVVQDIGSMSVVEKASVKPGDMVIDVCAAPGGKAIHAADKLQGKGRVIARDLTPYKVEMIEENVERLTADVVTPMVWDATAFDEKSKEQADVVIADLPCSGLGVIGRKGDIKYRVQPEDVTAIAALQRQILDTIWSYVKVGGTLMYSTCTLTKEENQDNRDYILAKLPFELVEEKELLPGVSKSDGFYMAKFKRVK